VAVVRVKVVVEVVDRAAGHRMFEELEAKGYNVETMGMGAAAQAPPLSGEKP